MKKVKLIIMAFAFAFVLALATTVNAATYNATVTYGEIKDKKVVVTFKFSQDLTAEAKESAESNHYTVKDSKTITREVSTPTCGYWYYKTISGDIYELQFGETPFEMNVNTKMTTTGYTIENLKSSDPSVIKIENGGWTAQKPGTAIITGKAKLIGGKEIDISYKGTVLDSSNPSKPPVDDDSDDDKKPTPPSEDKTDSIAWTDGSKIDLKASASALNLMKIQTNLEPKENRQYYIYISKKQNEEVTSKTEGVTYLSKNSDGKLSGNINKNYLELAGKNYVYIIEKITSTVNNGKEKVIVNGKELNNPELPTLGNRLDIWLYDVNKTMVSNKIVMSKDRQITYKLGKINSNDILKAFKNESSDVAFSKLLKYAKESKYLKEGTITVDGLNYNLVKDVNIEKDGYYFVYMIADTQNGKYNELEDVAIYKDNSGKSGNELVHFSFADIKLSDDNTNEKDNTTSDKKIPQTGIKATMPIVFALIVVIGAMGYLGYRRYNGIK